MDSAQTTPVPACYPHEPEDYAQFKRMVTDLQEWPDEVDSRFDMMVGQCRGCDSMISYPAGPSFEDITEPLCFEPKPGLDLALKNELVQLASAKVRLYNEIPPALAAALSRYVSKHIHPGDCLLGLLKGDYQQFIDHATNETLFARPQILQWLEVAAPDEAWGTEHNVRDWLADRSASAEEAA